MKHTMNSLREHYLTIRTNRHSDSEFIHGIECGYDRGFEDV
jgi:hypothetical protein